MMRVYIKTHHDIDFVGELQDQHEYVSLTDAYPVQKRRKNKARFPRLTYVAFPREEVCHIRSLTQQEDWIERKLQEDVALT